MPSDYPKVRAPWDSESVAFGDDGAAPYQRKPAHWEQVSMDSREMEEFDQQRRNAEAYQMQTPWAQVGDLPDNIEHQMAIVNINTAPWHISSTELRQQQALTETARSNYKFSALWEPVPLTDKRIEQIKNYSYSSSVPFRREDNQVEEKDKPKKKVIAKNNQTIAPWQQGTLPAPAPSAKATASEDNKNKKTDTSPWQPPPKESPKPYPFEPSGDPVLDSLREQLFNKGAAGILGLSRKFRIMDDDGNKTLDHAEFAKGMKETGLSDLTDKKIKHLFLFFDQDDSGTISLDEFMIGIRGQLNKRRKALVKLAFEVLDKDGSGEVNFEDIKTSYNAAMHKEVIAGRKTEKEILDEFLLNFDVGGKKDGVVTFDEFVNYYANISASVDHDDYFELMVRNAWHISGGDGWCSNTTNKRVLVTHADGRQTVEEIKKDLGLKQGDKKDMAQRLASQGLTAVKIDIAGNVEGDDYDEILGPSNNSLAKFLKKKPVSLLEVAQTNQQLQQQQQAYSSRNGYPRNTISPRATGGAMASDSIDNLLLESQNSSRGEGNNGRPNVAGKTVPAGSLLNQLQLNATASATAAGVLNNNLYQQQPQLHATTGLGSRRPSSASYNSGINRR